MAVRGRMELSSDDRLFPAQDVLPASGIGNLIAAPLQGRLRRDGATVFLDLATMEPHTDQWAYLSSLSRMSPRELERAIAAVGDVEIGGDSPLGLADYAEEIARSGFPAIRALAGPGTRRAQLDGYLARVIEHDFPEQGHLVRRPATLRAWLAAYAGATSTTTTYAKILAAATPGEGQMPATTTTIAYRNVLHQIWLLDPVPGWSTSKSSMARVAAAPKHHLADPALAARLLGVDAAALLSAAPPIAAPWLGRSRGRVRCSVPSSSLWSPWACG